MSGHVVTAASLTGRTIDGRYRLEERLGTGAYGVTYRARHIEHQRIVALKLMHEHLSGNAAERASFESDATKLARVGHPSIVTVVNYGEHTGQPWVACEWLEGETLAAQLARGGLPLGAALGIIRQLLAALASAHAARLVHRNLKPSNVILERRTGQGRERVKLIDFAPALHSASPEVLAGIVSPFSAPELAAGEALDARSDVFAVGATLIGMLNGSERDAQGNAATAPRGLTGIHARSLPGLDASLVTWIRRATSVHRALRFADAADALRELIDLLPRDVRSPTTLSEAASNARAITEGRSSRLTTRAVAPLPQLPSMSRSEIPPPPSNRAAAGVELPKASPAPNPVSEARDSEARDRITTSEEPPAGPELRSNPLVEPEPVEPEPLISLAVRAESARGTLRPIEKRIGNVIAEPWLLQLTAAGVFVFLLVALGVFWHSRARPSTPASSRMPATSTEESKTDRLDAPTHTPSSIPAPVTSTPAPIAVEMPPAEPPHIVVEPSPPSAAAPSPTIPPVATVTSSQTVRANSLSIVAAPGHSAIRDPWQEPAPQMLKRWHELGMNGAPGAEGTVKAVREYNRDHPTDIRGYLVIGQLYLNRFWRADCVEAFAAAIERDSTARGAPEVLPALLDMVAQGKVTGPAQRLILKAYGTEALDPIDQAFEEVRNPEYAARLHALRLKIMEASPTR